MSKKQTSVGVEYGGSVGGYVVDHAYIQRLEGKLLTFIEATFTDHTQREALKSLIRNQVWAWYGELYPWNPYIELSWIGDANGGFKKVIIKNFPKEKVEVEEPK